MKMLDNYELSQIADALRTEEYAAGAVIMTQGDVGDKFYIVEEGEARATKSGDEVMLYKTGDYFGELAVIRNQPRAATVRAFTPVKVLTLDRASFKRLLPVGDLMERAMAYK